MFVSLVISLIVFNILSCTSKTQKTKIWIYTSLYKDTISDIKPRLEQLFPNIDLQFYQAGSEDVAAKVQAEQTSGQIQADILISSDRFWYEELAAQNQLSPLESEQTKDIPEHFKHPQKLYHTLSHPIMILAFNTDSVDEKSAPHSYKELKESKWKDKVSMPSPLASGTSFTSVAFLSKEYGWSYFEDLKKNNIIAEGGNSGVIRRLQNKERPIGIVLLENVLRLQKSDPRIKYILPTDGAIIHSNVLAIVKKESSEEVKTLKNKIADWFFSDEGQKIMTQSFMYAARKGFPAPEGAPDWDKVVSQAPKWNAEFLKETMKNRSTIKDQFSKIFLQ